MACEFLGHEYKTDKGHISHRIFCVANGEGCLVDDPLGYINCCRRTFLLMQTLSPPLKVTRTKRKRADTSQHALF